MTLPELEPVPIGMQMPSTHKPPSESVNSPPKPLDEPPLVDPPLLEVPPSVEPPEQLPLWQLPPTWVQSSQAIAPWPHAVSTPLVMQLPVTSQQPVHVLALQGPFVAKGLPSPESSHAPSTPPPSPRPVPKPPLDPLHANVPTPAAQMAAVTRAGNRSERRMKWLIAKIPACKA
jgi:hypothetical protein